MQRSPPQPARRTRLPRRSLTRAVIIDAAERVSADDVQGLTVRAVASELQSAPMALYRYFATKDELVDALLDRVLGRFDLEGETEHWLEGLQRFGHAHRSFSFDTRGRLRRCSGTPTPG